MSTIQEIQEAISRLAPQELEDLQGWMEKRYDRPIDEQLAAGLEAGHFDSRIRQALR